VFGSSIADPDLTDSFEIDTEAFQAHLSYNRYNRTGRPCENAGALRFFSRSPMAGDSSHIFQMASLVMWGHEPCCKSSDFNRRQVYEFTPMSTEKSESQETGFFRCPVQSDQSQAVIRVGWRKAIASVQETSIDGFTVVVPANYASSLKVGRPWLLEYQGAKIEVHPQWFFNSPDGRVQMGLRRMRDLTPPPPIRKSLLLRYAGRRYEDPSYSAAIFGGFVLALFSLMALPGLGDSLGTSLRIQNAVRWFLDGLDHSIGQYL
jgi:hypothetical protein